MRVVDQDEFGVLAKEHDAGTSRRHPFLVQSPGSINERIPLGIIGWKMRQKIIDVGDLFVLDDRLQILPTFHRSCGSHEGMERKEDYRREKTHFIPLASNDL